MTVTRKTEVWCGYCTDESNPYRSKLGTLRRQGELWHWTALDPRWVNNLRKAGGWWGSPEDKWRSRGTIAAPGVPVPDELWVRCSRHGVGYIDTHVFTDAGGTLAVRYRVSSQ